MPMHERNPAYKRGLKSGRFAGRRSMNARAGERRLSRPRRDAFGQLIREERFGGKMDLAPAWWTPMPTSPGGAS
ncbi:MAG: hypothetical protein ACOX87_13520 [Chloroflexota bacterium]|jgi:hypothetical protein